MAALQNEIIAAYCNFRKLYTEGDFVALSNLYTEDCKLLPFGAPMLQGREAIGKVFQSLHASGFTDLLTTTTETGTAGGDVVYSVANFKFFLADGKVAQEGK
ncbi:uncharacterized protein [Apostichopus japonicus]|uniref:uncharacterized protein n=1 Tax=Stichopus japonicus TaxID=307972 RepID=UPI003AB6B6C2